VPTVLRRHGFRFFFFSNEGKEPPHIHVELAGAHAKFWLEPVSLVFSSNFSTQQLAKLRNLVDTYKEFFKECWYEYFH